MMAKEYIEREALRKKIFPYEGIDKAKYAINAKAVEAAINGTPAADVAEVVRCKDCIYYEANCCFNSQWDMESSPEVPMVCENDFCSQGERKEQG